MDGSTNKSKCDQTEDPDRLPFNFNSFVGELGDSLTELGSSMPDPGRVGPPKYIKSAENYVEGQGQVQDNMPQRLLDELHHLQKYHQLPTQGKQLFRQRPDQVVTRQPRIRNPSQNHLVSLNISDYHDNPQHGLLGVGGLPSSPPPGFSQIDRFQLSTSPNPGMPLNSITQNQAFTPRFDIKSLADEIGVRIEQHQVGTRFQEMSRAPVPDDPHFFDRCPGMSTAAMYKPETIMSSAAPVLQDLQQAPTPYTTTTAPNGNGVITISSIGIGIYKGQEHLEHQRTQLYLNELPAISSQSKKITLTEGQKKQRRRQEEKKKQVIKIKDPITTEKNTLDVHSSSSSEDPAQKLQEPAISKKQARSKTAKKGTSRVSKSREDTLDLESENDSVYSTEASLKSISPTPIDHYIDPPHVIKLAKLGDSDKNSDSASKLNVAGDENSSEYIVNENKLKKTEKEEDNVEKGENDEKKDFLILITNAFSLAANTQEKLTFSPKQRIKYDRDFLLQIGTQSERIPEFKTAERGLPDLAKDVYGNAVAENAEMITRGTRSILKNLSPGNLEKSASNLMELGKDNAYRITHIAQDIFNEVIKPVKPPLASTPPTAKAQLHAGLIYAVCKTKTKKESRKLFLTQIFDRCHQEFQKLLNFDDTLKSMGTNNKAGKRNNLRISSIANVKFLGELYLQQMLTLNSFMENIRLLLCFPREETLGCFCLLLVAAGEKLEMDLKTMPEFTAFYGHEKKSISSREWTSKIIEDLENLPDKESLPLGLRGAVDEVEKLYKNGWKLPGLMEIVVGKDQDNYEQNPRSNGSRFSFKKTDVFNAGKSDCKVEWKINPDWDFMDSDKSLPLPEGLLPLLDRFKNLGQVGVDKRRPSSSKKNKVPTNLRNREPARNSSVAANIEVLELGGGHKTEGTMDDKITDDF